MKLEKGLIISLIFFAFLQVCKGQEKSQAIMIDTVSYLDCEQIKARTDSFFRELLQDPNSQGYVVIYPKRNSLKEGLSFEKIIRVNIYLRAFDKSRIKVVRSKENDIAMVEFWKLPSKAEKPSFVEEKWIETPITKPFIFGTDWVDSSCPTFIAGDYANLIKGNPNLRGNIVIFNQSKKEAQSEMVEWLKLFTEEYKIPRNRLKIFFGKNKHKVDTEFWIVPQK